jgi:hypothetical protein
MQEITPILLFQRIYLLFKVFWNAAQVYAIPASYAFSSPHKNGHTFIEQLKVLPAIYLETIM